MRQNNLEGVARVVCGVILSGLFSVAFGADGKASATGVGQEMKALEKTLTDAKPMPSAKKPEVKVKDEPDKNGAKPEPARAEKAEPKPPKSGYKFTKLEVRGDVDLLKLAELYASMRKEVEGQTLDDRDVQEMARRYTKKLVGMGYYLASIWAPPVDYTLGTLVFEVDKGRVGTLAFYNPQDKKGTGRKSFSGWYFSKRQLEQSLGGMKSGDTFDYTQFYRSLYYLNMNPDLTIDTDMKVRKEQVGGRLQRYVDMDFMVEEELPIHVIFGIGNSGTKASGDWRPSMTLQHLNLTKHDDILTWNVGPLSTDLAKLKSSAGSYYLPHHIGNGGGSTLFMGYSELDTENVTDDVDNQIDIKGKGWFVGLQETYKLLATPKHFLSVSLGITYRYIEDQLILAATSEEARYELDAREIVLVPLSLAFSYSSGQADALGGRNFVTLQTVAHFDGALGASNEEEIQTLRANADATYYIERIQLARLQPIFGRDEYAGKDKTGRRLGEWTLFGKVDGQIASGSLIPAEQKAIGGGDSVRGFPERIVQGDHGVSGSVELRTPLFSSFFGSPYKKPEDRRKALDEGNTLDRLQLVGFLDAGYVKTIEPLGVTDSYTAASAGAGLRLALTKYSQIRFDWGVPIYGREEIARDSVEEIRAAGRYYFSAQIQF